MQERDSHERESGHAGHSGAASPEPRFGDSPKPHGDKLPGRGGAQGLPGGGSDAGETARDIGEDPTHDAAGRPADDA